MSDTRVYIVKRNDSSDVRLVRAANPAQVARHIVKSTYSIDRPSQDELIASVSGGVKVEEAGADDQQQLPLGGE